MLYEEACSALRPTWDGGRVTGLQEAAFLVSEPISLILIAATVFALWHKGGLLAFLVGAAWLVWIAHITLLGMLDDPRFTAIEIGRIGPSGVFSSLILVIVAGLAGSAILPLMKRRHA